MGDRGEGHQADGSQPRIVGALAIVEERHEKNDEDRGAADVEDQARPVAGLACFGLLEAAHEQGNDQIVRDHDGERYGFHDDHRGGG